MRHTLFSLCTMYINRLRTAWWRFFFNKGSGAFIVYGRIKVYSPQNVIIGDRSTINEGVILNARVNITIGKHVHLSPNCILNTGGLDVTQRCEKRVHISKPIIIHDGVWIGSGAMVNPGITIGEDSVIGAGTVVTKDVPPGVVVVGNPGTILKEIAFEAPSGEQR